MTQAYSNPSRESDPHALPDVEVFYIDATEAAQNAALDEDNGEDGVSLNEPGYYYWYCFPGCMPDSDPIGPFATKAAAIAAAQEDSDDGEIGDYSVNAGSHIDPADLA